MSDTNETTIAGYAIRRKNDTGIRESATILISPMMAKSSWRKRV